MTDLENTSISLQYTMKLQVVMYGDDDGFYGAGVAANLLNLYHMIRSYISQVIRHPTG